MLEIIRPEIFDYQKLQAGVTTVNKRMFPKYGLTLSSFDTPDDVDFNLHLQLFAHMPQPIIITVFTLFSINFLMISLISFLVVTTDIVPHTWT
jgi:hypothetical protein